MDNRLYVSYFLNKKSSATGKHAVYLSITIAGKRQRVHTGVFVLDGQWDSNKGRIKMNDESSFTNNQLLAALETRTTEIYTDFIKQKLPMSSYTIKQKLRCPGKESGFLIELIEAHNKYVKRKVGVEVSKATHTKYETLKLKVKEYMRKEHQTNNISLDELNKAFLIGFELYLKVEDHIGHNTTIKYIQFLKRVINYGIGMEWLQHDPFKAFKCSMKPVLRECLTQEEIEQIQTTDLTRESLINVRNIFVFCCYTGLTYSDVKKLKHGEIIKGIDGTLWIQTFRAKTNIRVPVPLLPKALEMMSLYLGDSDPDSLVFPVPSNQKMNEYLKEIAGLCKIRKKISCHIARHSFATTITLSNGVPIETVSKMLGHTNIKTTQIYSKVVDFKISGDMNLLKKKIDQAENGNLN
jgi:site-specific recombinase XerD